MDRQVKLFDSPAMREVIRRLIRSHMALKGMDYRGLSQVLSEQGVEQTEGNLRSKVNSGALGAQLFMYILIALDVSELNVHVVRDLLGEVIEEEASA